MDVSVEKKSSLPNNRFWMRISGHFYMKRNRLKVEVEVNIEYCRCTWEIKKMIPSSVYFVLNGNIGKHSYVKSP